MYEIEPYCALELTAPSANERLSVPGLAPYFTRSGAPGDRLWLMRDRVLIVRVVASAAVTSAQLLAAGWMQIPVNPQLP